MAIDRCFEAALQKAVRSLEMRNRDLLWEDPTWTRADLERLIREPNDLRLWALMAALRRGLDASRRSPSGRASTRSSCTSCGRSARLRATAARGLGADAAPWPGAPSGSASPIARWAHCSTRCPSASASGAAPGASGRRTRWSIPAPPSSRPSRPTSTARTSPRTRRPRSRATKVVVLGSGPIRIGQGIEFDYCSVRARDGAARPRRAEHHDQLEPRDGQHRLRRLDAPVLRAARRRVSARRPGKRDRRRRRQPRACSPSSAVRPRSTWPSRSSTPATPARLGPARHRRGRGPRPVRAICSTTWAFRSRRAASSRTPERGRPAGRPARLSGAGAAVVRARRTRDGDLSRPDRAVRVRGASPRRSRARSRSWSTSTWRASRSRSTPCATGATC